MSWVDGGSLSQTYNSIRNQQIRHSSYHHCKRIRKGDVSPEGGWPSWWSGQSGLRHVGTDILMSPGASTNVSLAYTSINASSDNEKHEFHDCLKIAISSSRLDVTILTGDLDDKVGAENGKHCQALLSGKQLSRRRDPFSHLHRCQCIHQITWTFPDGSASTQLDYVITNRKWRRWVVETHVRLGACVMCLIIIWP
ncbi:unnamed protein product [Soboliphyme baturini]|uniref:Reelin domain-containing protein n=1 Tax=Soboliphyme baturini TaxID=241478 RepID=A0A183IU69_9BILA|nr:unnamed protein product [Soboliphyme baturini]